MAKKSVTRGHGQYSRYNPETINKSKGYKKVEQVTLPATEESWRVYRVGSEYTAGNEIGLLAPSKYGGLTYDILDWLSNNVVKIRTESYGEVAIYIGSETGAKIIKQFKPITESEKIDNGGGKELNNDNVELEEVNGNKGTIAPFAISYVSGKKIPSNVKGNTYTIIGSKHVKISKSEIAYNIKELNEWVLEQDILEAYGLNNTKFDPNGNIYPGRFTKLSVGTDVQIRQKATHFLNGNHIEKEVKDKKYRIISIINIEKSHSDTAYQLSGLNEYVLEQDIIEAWENARPNIVAKDSGIEHATQEPIEKSDVIIGGYLDGNVWKKVTVVDDTYIIKSKDIRIGYLNINGNMVKNQYLIKDVEYKATGIFGSMLNPINAIKFNLPKGYEYRVMVDGVGLTKWTNNAFAGGKDNIITEIQIRKIK